MSINIFISNVLEILLTEKKISPLQFQPRIVLTTCSIRSATPPVLTHAPIQNDLSFVKNTVWMVASAPQASSYVLTTPISKNNNSLPVGFGQGLSLLYLDLSHLQVTSICHVSAEKRYLNQLPIHVQYSESRKTEQQTNQKHSLNKTPVLQ